MNCLQKHLPQWEDGKEWVCPDCGSVYIAEWRLNPYNSWAAEVVRAWRLVQPKSQAKEHIN